MPADSQQLSNLVLVLALQEISKAASAGARRAHPFQCVDCGKKCRDAAALESHTTGGEGGGRVPECLDLQAKCKVLKGGDEATTAVSAGVVVAPT